MKNIHQILQSTDETDVYDQILDRLWDKSDNGSRLEKLTGAERNLIVSQRIQDAIIGGGIDSLFFNNGGTWAKEGVSVFREIGDTRSAGIIEKALSLFPVQPVPDDVDAVREIMEGWEDDNDISDQWYDLDEDFDANLEELHRLTIAYVRKHTDQFILE